jgi:hypothetical protein
MQFAPNGQVLRTLGKVGVAGSCPPRPIELLSGLLALLAGM